MSYGGVSYAGGAYAGQAVAPGANDALPILAVEVAFTTDALATPAWVDITGDVREWDTTRGRNRELERFQPGRATVVLDNRLRRYDSQAGLPAQFIDLPGTSGNYVSTPDSAAVSITGDIDIRVKVALDDWTPGGASTLVAKMGSPNHSYDFRVPGSSGTLQLILSPDGTNIVAVASSVATGFTDGTTHWVRVTWDDAGNVANFYTSEDGDTWTLLGDADRAIASAGIFDGTAPVTVGAEGTGATNRLAGSVYYAEVRNGIDGTVVAKFDPNTVPQQGTRTPSSWTSETGEVWTVNGSAWAWGGTWGTPWYGNLKPMRRVRIRETFNGVTYPVFDGFVDKWQLDYPQHGKDATATIVATDLTKILARTDLPRSVYTSEVEDAAPDVWWRLDDLAYSTTALSAVGTAKDGTVVGGPDFQAESLVVHDNGTSMATPKDTDGPSDKGIELDLGDASLTVNGGTPLAFEFWVRRKPNNAASGSGGLENYAFLTNSAGTITPVRFGLFISNADDSKLKWHAINDAETTEWGVRSNFTLALDTTYHVAAVHGSDRVLRLYINGVDVSEASPGTAGSTTSGTITADEMKFMERGTINTPDAIVDEFAFYLGTIPTLADFAEHNTAGRAPWNGDLPGARIGRVLDIVGCPDDQRELDDGATALQSATLGTSALEHIQKVAETEFGLLFVDRAGNVRFVARSAVFGRTAAAGAVFGDGAGEIGYRAIKFDDGDEVIRNRATITQLNGIPAVEENTASVSEFGRFDYDLSGLYHDSLTHSEDYAEFIVAEYKDPRRRVVSLTLGPAEIGAEDDLYPQMLGRELGDAIVVKNRPPGGGTAFSQTCVIEGIRHRSVPGPGNGTRGHLTTTWILSPEYSNEF